MVWSPLVLNLYENNKMNMKYLEASLQNYVICQNILYNKFNYHLSPQKLAFFELFYPTAKKGYYLNFYYIPIDIIFRTKIVILVD